MLKKRLDNVEVTSEEPRMHREQKIWKKKNERQVN
jgi:hypothetical protein